MQSKDMSLLRMVFVVMLIERAYTACLLQGMAEGPELTQKGDLIIGGIFSFRTGQKDIIDTFETIPQKRQCQKYV